MWRENIYMTWEQGYFNTCTISFSVHKVVVTYTSPVEAFATGTGNKIESSDSDSKFKATGLSRVVRHTRVGTRLLTYLW